MCVNMVTVKCMRKEENLLKFRHEHKHSVNGADIMELRTRLCAVMKRDDHCDDDGKYIVKSLYFDNYLDKALREKVDGVRNREKFRIRYYGDDTSFIRLEKKSKINGLCLKQSAPLTAEECDKIIRGDTGFLINSGNPLKQEFYAKIHYQLLRPKEIVCYERESFTYPAGNVRVTIDSHISGSSNVREFLNPNLAYSTLISDSVLEVKWDEFLPEIIKNCVQLKSRRSSAFSKYAAARI